MAEKDGLWDSDEPGKQVAPTSTNDLTATQVIEAENNLVTTIVLDTVELKTMVDQMEKIVVAAYEVANYTPHFSGANKEKMESVWVKQIIPNLVESLVQDVKARNTIVSSLSAVRDLAITIRNCGQNVNDSKGSERAIQVAKELIQKALDNLDASIKKAEDLENTAVKAFASQTNEILQLAGPNAVKVVDDIARLERENDTLYLKIDELNRSLSDKCAEVERHGYMMMAIEKHTLDAQAQIKADNERLEEQKRMNEEVERAIQNVHRDVQQTVTKTEGWLFWRRTTTTTTTKDSEQKESDIRYYDEVMRSRMARISKTESSQDKKKAEKKMLEEEYAKTKGAYEKAKMEMEALKRKFTEEFNDQHKKIKENKLEIAKIRANRTDLEQKFGHCQDTLVDCLVNVRNFGQSLRGGATAYAPLVAILKAIKATVEFGAKMLSGEREDVYLGGKTLLHTMPFLASYSVNARKALEGSPKYRKISDEDPEEFRTKLAIRDQ